MIPNISPSRAFRPLTILSLLLILTPFTTAAAVSAWWTELGAQVVRQNATTGLLTYSMCNSNSTPIFPVDPPLTLDTSSFPPRNGTALVGRGWFDGTTPWASIFYQSANGALINAVFTCNYTSGQFAPQSSRAISTKSLEGVKGATPHADTGLAAVLLGPREGYRVFYHDEMRRVHLLTYADGVNRGQWAYGGVISGWDVTMSRALVAEFSSTRNTSVVYLKDKENFGVTRYMKDPDSWASGAFPRPLNATYQEALNFTALNATNNIPRPLNMTTELNFTLPHFDGTAAAVGMSIDKAFTRNVFYVGGDRRVYQVANINWTWRMMNNQTDSVWPVADAPGAEIAVASDFESSIVRLYYESGGKLVEARLDTDGIWKPAVALPAVNTTIPVINDKPAASATPSPTAAASTNGLSTGAKAGLGVGIAAGALALAGVVAVFVLIRRRNARRKAAKNEAAIIDAKRKQDEEIDRGLRWQHQFHSQHHAEGWQNHDHSPNPISNPMSAGAGGAFLEWPAGARETMEAQELYGADAFRHVHELGGGAGGYEMMGEGHYREMGSEKSFLDWDAQAEDSKTEVRSVSDVSWDRRKSQI